MIILVLMLAVAYIPTAQYTWDSVDWKPQDPLRPAPQDYAICYFGYRQIGQVEDEMYSGSQQRMMLSVALLVGGMLKRLWHLFYTPTQVFLQVRASCSCRARHILQHLHRWSTKDALWSHLVMTFVYQPLLAIFLTFRVMTDLLGSRGFEVCSCQDPNIHSHCLTALGMVVGSKLFVRVTEPMDTEIF